MFHSHVVSISAVASYQEQLLKAKHKQLLQKREREAEEWEDEHLLPLMANDQRSAFLAERKRLKERREDIERQERQHRELVAVESRKAAAMERQARKSSLGAIGLGVVLGSILDGD